MYTHTHVHTYTHTYTQTDRKTDRHTHTHTIILKILKKTHDYTDTPSIAHIHHTFSESAARKPAARLVYTEAAL
jgi:hypothetical protein